MRRREFIAVLGALALTGSPYVGHSQAGGPRVGLLIPGSPADSAPYQSAFLLGLKEAGYADGENVDIDMRWGEGEYDRLSGLAADLVRRGDAVIAAGGPPATLAVAASTRTVPIVAVVGDDPIVSKLIGSYNRPTGNVTGVAPFGGAALWGKRLELLRAMLPKAASIAVLVNPADESAPKMTELSSSAQSLGITLLPLTASSDAEIEAAFTTAAERHADGILVSEFPFFTVRHAQIAALAARFTLPAIYGWPDYVRAGGLMSYGSSLTDAWRQVGVYVGRILQGARPAELPVQQPTKLELIVNLKTAKALGLDVPPSLLARADEVIE